MLINYDQIITVIAAEIAKVIIRSLKDKKNKKKSNNSKNIIRKLKKPKNRKKNS